MFDQQALQEYILLCCQNPTGGLLDKPGKSVPHPLDTHTHTTYRGCQQHAHSVQTNVIHILLSQSYVCVYVYSDPETFTTRATA